MEPVRNQLWPIPAAMHQNLDNWVSYTRELETRLDTLTKAHQKAEANFTQRIAQLRRELEETEKPLLDRIMELEGANTQLKLSNDSLRQEMDNAVRLLSTAVEATGKPLPLVTLVNDAIMLVEQAKEQLRESL